VRSSRAVGGNATAENAAAAAAADRAFAANIALGIVLGPAVLLLSSYVLAWACRMLGGVGGTREIRTVLAWSSIVYFPMLHALVLVPGVITVLIMAML